MIEAILLCHGSNFCAARYRNRFGFSISCDFETEGCLDPILGSYLEDRFYMVHDFSTEIVVGADQKDVVDPCRDIELDAFSFKF